MRILQIDKFFYNRGGSTRIFFETIDGLRAKGQEVAEFATQDPRNKTSAFARYFPPAAPELETALSKIDLFKAFKHRFFSGEVDRRLSALVSDFRPEVAHLHNAFGQASASVFVTLNQLRVPIVLTLHDPFPLFPNPVEKLEAYYYRLRIWKNIRLFICPCEFLARKMVEAGFPKEKMRVIRNPFSLPAHCPPLGTKVLYSGILNLEKGIRNFMRAAQLSPNLQFVVAGEGPDEAWVNNFIKDNKLTNVEQVGWLEGEALQKVMNEAKVVVVPSVSYENCSFRILEALCLGRIVVASRRGGNPEMVKDGETGFLSRPDDPEDLARVIARAMSLSADDAGKIVERGRQLVLRDHNPDQYFRLLLAVYEEAMRH